MTRLSVNINKWATLRNARGGTQPDLIRTARRIEEFGGQGITIHPRPDERHIRYDDARQLKEVVTTEFNIEGNPIPRFIKLIEEVRPDQVTLVPDGEDAITSDHGWDTIGHRQFLTETIAHFKTVGVRTSIFVDPDVSMVEGAAAVGTDRIELYTESYAHQYPTDPGKAISPFTEAAKKAAELGLGLNAGHDLNLDNIAFFASNTPGLLEVSIGHALICESIDLGLENVIAMYLNRLQS
jgi:pyridoxine 5-phosphate synthase